ncbi:MAG: mechanosensitive ion channel [Myxococcales bacterium]|jgi:potassium efflux system protein
MTNPLRKSLLWGLAVSTLALHLTSLASAQLSPAPVPAEQPSQPSEPSQESAEIERKAQELRTRLQEWQAQSAEYLRATEQAPARIEVLDREIATLQKEKGISIDEGATAAELEMKLAQAEQDLASARREAAELDAEAEARSERRRKIPELLSIGKQRLKELDRSTVLPSVDPEIADALVRLRALRRAVQQAEIEAYQNELGSYEARGAVMAKKRDYLTLQIGHYQGLIERLRDAKQQRERLEIEQANEASKRLMKELTTLPEGAKETLQKLYERNEALASLWSGEEGLHEQIRDVSEKLARAEDKVAQIESELSRLAARVEAVGLADSVGALLRQHRAEAPDIGMYRRFIRMRQEQIGDVQLQQIRLREQRLALADIDALVDEAMSTVDESVPDDQRREIEALLRQLFETQRKYMDALLADYETYFQKLVDFDARQQELIDRTRDLLDFIDERILWIPSGKAVQPELLSDGGDAISWLLGSTYLKQLATAIADAATRLWVLHILVLIWSGLFFVFARPIRRRIASLGEEAGEPDCDQIMPTAYALGLSVLLALWLPTVVAYAGWRIGVSPVATQYARSIAHGLLVAAAFWATLRVARQLVRPEGIAEAHCAWPATAARTLWSDLRWFSVVTVPLVFLIFVFEMRGESLWRESVGRLAFLVSMAAVAAFNHFSLRPGRSLGQVLRARGPRHRWAWLLFRASAVLLPILLAAAAISGFYWTALQLSVRLHLSVALFFGLVIGVQLYTRWSMVNARRAAREDEGLDDKPKAPPPTMEVSRLMIGAGALIGLLGLMAIWADLLPATRVLEEVQLWTTTQKISVSEIDPSGVAQTSTEDRVVAITLADLFRSLLYALLTLASMRVLPGIVEATVLRRLGPGERYAYSTIFRYAIVLTGLTIAFDALGVGWSSIQWLVAAIGLGLGFGLQEIFANFVSGLIILFERPIRVGDTVTVGEVSGTVSRIQIRATWITAFDRKELIVPNKEFVTGRLINWTLSDSVLRVEIPVGIAYGSDTNRAIEVLNEVARESWRVLNDPPPQVLFLGFGDSSLSFELRVYIRSVNNLLPVQHEMHMNIDKAFRDAGIEIAFPQRDLHLRSLPPGWSPPSGDAK